MEKNQKLVKNQNKFPLNYQDIGVKLIKEEFDIEKILYRNIQNIQNPKTSYFSISFYKSITRFV
jgi:hypothetical protein